jgi:hypothetical protein
MKLSLWAVAVLALGWLAVPASALVFGRGHPPAAFVVGEGVVMASFVIAPIGAGAAAFNMWRSRRRGTGIPRRVAVALGLNLLFLLVACILWLWLLSMSA